MAFIKSKTHKLEEWAKKRAAAIWDNLQTNHLWQRMFKNTLATTLAVILALIPAVLRVYGRAVYLAPITTVFGHPGRRTGMMVEALVLAVGGTLVGVAWSVFGIYLSSLIYDQNAPAAYTIRGIFLTIALLVHGFLRSHTPRLFISLVLLIIVSVVCLTSTATAVSKPLATQILYPILTAAGILILVNILVFPELSSDFLGTTTIETLALTVDTLRDAGKYFINIGDEVGKNSPETSPEEELETHSKEDEATPKTHAKTSFRQKVSGLFQKSKENKEVPESQSPKVATLKSLTERKAKLREKLSGCKAAQQECNFELTFAVLPPEALKEISVTAMTKLVANAIALIGACESKYALMGDETEKDKSQVELVAIEAGIESGSENTPHNPEDGSPSSNKGRHKESPWRPTVSQVKRMSTFEQGKENLELVKPKKEIEFGDAELLRFLVAHIAKPLASLQDSIDKSVEVVTSCLAYCYDVAKLPSGTLAPTGVHLQDIDVYVDILTEAMIIFDKDSAIALESAASLHKVQQAEVDVMPRMEIFLISLFLLSLRHAALHTLEMLRHSRVIVEKRQTRHNRRRLYAPQINWRKWLASGGEEDSLALPDNARQGARTGNSDLDPQENSFDSSDDSLLAKRDVEANPPTNVKEEKSRKSVPEKSTAHPTRKRIPKKSLASRVRNGLADGIEYLVGSEDVIYAVKLAVAVLLVTWPAFLHQWNQWYSLNRGLWASLQLVLITEVAIGTSVMTFALRAVGTTFGCVWGYVAYEVDNGNRIVCVVILIIGIIPSTYLQLGSKYIKAGMVSIISMCVVSLATISQTVPGDTATENFLKRFIAFLIGGMLALILQFTFIPVKARDRLVESLASSITQIIEMEACLAYGIEMEVNLDVHVHSALVSERFDHAKGKAQAALATAGTFLPFCANEPRLKGSFKGLALIYEEILYVLHAIVDRMDNMIHLRYSYGSGVLEELNTQVFPYRRNVASAITIVLFAVHEALTTKLPLPQFLPSARLAHLRMVNRVREVVLEKETAKVETQDSISRPEVEVSMVKRVIRQKFLSWNAASAGQIETIEFLEELIDLTKLLVGANEFRSGMLTRPTYHNSFGRTNPRDMTQGDEEDEERDIMPPEGQEQQKTTTLRKRPTFSRNKDADKGTRPPEDKKLDEEELPRSLQRVRSRRVEEMNLQRYRSIEQDSVTRGGKLPGREKP
ncbi:hypothetical protein BJ875DRAFT_387903 [Amylocarpus encephaloides]|uniref:ER transporter 6TM N-terminal domain-containing protein n=1 Tax=Amylocarpus encephaloides TaxID=45428 RepID=A0A9P7Y9Y3_9HELO|nr:hypothetical protein BJ875DRAFT_387903 [Amylocarpus encephaloides]